MKIKEYNLDSSKDIQDKRLAVVSDLHISSHTNSANLQSVLKTVSSLHPTEIVMPGDLYNASDKALNKNENIFIVLDFLDELAKIADVFISFGNSELEPWSPNNPINEGKIANSALSLMNKLSSIHFGKKYYQIKRGYTFLGQFTTHLETRKDDIDFSALNPDYDYYHKTSDCIKDLIDKYETYLQYLASNLNPKAFNVLLMHDPLIIEAFERLDGLKAFDLVISGHNHGGLFPQSLKPLFRLMPSINMDKLYPKYIKGMIRKETTNFIVSEGVTKFHSSMQKLESLEKFHEGTIELIKIKGTKKLL